VIINGGGGDDYNEDKNRIEKRSPVYSQNRPFLDYLRFSIMHAFSHNH